MVGSLYKLLAKVLANRLKKVVAKVDFNLQNSLVEERQILDVILITNEAIGSWLKNYSNVVLYDLDIEKACV